MWRLADNACGNRWACFSMQRTLFKNLREEIQELEKANLDPTTAVQQASRKKLVFHIT